MALSTSLTSSNDAPPHLQNTLVPSGRLNGNLENPRDDAPLYNEKKPRSHIDDADEEEEEDMDALIEELESEDGAVGEEEDVINEPGGARPVPEGLLNTDTRVGLTEAEVILRRKKFGLNQMKEEKENLTLKFLGYFVGPIQFVMEVRKI